MTRSGRTAAGPLAARALTSLRLRAADAAELALGRRDELVPPRRLRNLTGNSDFEATGEEFGRHLSELAGLTSSDRVLDIGCGAGRIARVLARQLRPPGSYDGFDVISESVAWCGAHYRRTAAPFRFVHANLYNAFYNPGGVGDASGYRFPYPDGSFDLVVASSVFTHLRAEAADHYLREAVRVLAPGGRLFSTWFLLDETGDRDRPELIHFEPLEGPEATADRSLPESAVAYDAGWVRERAEAHDLVLRGPVMWGSWSGRRGPTSQDIVVAYRRD